MGFGECKHAKAKWRSHREKIQESRGRSVSVGSCDASVKFCRAAEGGPQALQKAEVEGRRDNAMRRSPAWKEDVYSAAVCW